jgi:alpha-N-arabinofuranosidase
MDVIAFDPSADREITVERRLFGHNLEHTRSAVFQGLSAQLLRNRKFAGKPAAHFGQAAEWSRIGPENVFFCLDPLNAYVRHVKKTDGDLYDTANEINAQIIQNPIDGQTAGIAQKDLPLQGGVEYQARAVLKARGKTPLDIIIRVINSSGKIRREKVFTAIADAWQRYDFVFTWPEDSEDVSFELMFTGRHELCIGAVSLLPVKNFHGMRIDVIDMMKELGITLLRWPGGNFAGEYNWKDGLLDVDMRAPQLSYQPVETHPHSGGYDYHEIGTDDFIALCREISAEPYLTINLGRDSPEESAQWVEYCNGGADTEWGRKRIERGFVEPYNVRYWSLGNEFGHGHMEGLNTPESYAEKALLSAAAMKKVDPSITLFASGPYTPERDPEPWVRKVLPSLAKEITYISYHAYQWSFVHGVDFVTDEGLKESYEKIISAPLFWLDKLTKLRSLLDAEGENTKKIAVSFDEWNVFFAWFHNPCIIEGIFTALMLEMICKEYAALNMPVCMYFQPVNEGAIIVYPFKCELSPNGQVFSVMKKHIGGSLLAITNKDPDLRCLGTRNADDEGILITLINKSFDREISFKCGVMFPPVKKGTLLNGEGMMLHGSKFKIIDVFDGGEKEHSFVIPPHSIMQLQF